MQRLKEGEKTICYECEGDVIARKDNYIEYLCDSGFLCDECIAFYNKEKENVI